MYILHFWCVFIGLNPGWKCTRGIFDRSKFKVTRDISPTISGWLLVRQILLGFCVAYRRAAVGAVRLTGGDVFAGGCFLRSRWRCRGSTSAPSTSCWSTSSPSTTADTSSTTHAGWSAARPTRRCQSACTSTPTRRWPANSGWARSSRSTSSNSPTTSPTNTDLWVDTISVVSVRHVTKVPTRCRTDRSV